MNQPASALPPGPLWRRLAAAVYDLLMLVALVMTAILLALAVAAPLDLDHGPVWSAFLRGYGLSIGLAYFGWCWTHGGQTLGLRAWRLRLRRGSGGDIGWRIAMVRYGWALVGPLTGLWVLAVGDYARWAVNAASAALIAPYLPCLFDARTRSLPDLLAGTEITRSAVTTSGRAPELPNRGQQQ